MIKCKCKVCEKRTILKDIKELENVVERNINNKIRKKKYENRSKFFREGITTNPNKIKRTWSYGKSYESDWRGYTKPKTSTPKAKVTVKTDTRFSDLEINALIVAVSAIELLIKKHNDYGPKNISDAPGGPLNGLAVRLHDKVARLNNLTSHNKKPSNETLEDTFVDILNYAVIGLLVLKDKWDK